MSYIDRSAVKIRRMTASDVDTVMSLQWAKIPEKEMVSSQRGGRLDASFIAELEGRLVGFVLAQLVYVGRGWPRAGKGHPVNGHDSRDVGLRHRAHGIGRKELHRVG